MKKILIIDDDPNIRCAVRAELTAAGHNVLEASTVENGIKRSRELLPDLVLCDFHLDEGSGFDVLSALRLDLATVEIPVILITGDDNELIARKSMDLGADDFLRKPFSGEQLRSAVEARLKRLEAFRARPGESPAAEGACFEAMATAALDGILMLNREGVIRFWNRTAERIFGYTAEEVMGLDLHELIVPGERSKLHLELIPRLQVKDATEIGGQSMELTFNRKDGSPFTAELSLTAVCLYEHWHTMAIVRDLSWQRQAQDRLRMLSKAVDQSIASIVITDTEGQIEYVNQKFCTLTGYDASEVIGKNPRVLKSDYLSPEAYRSLWQRLTSGKEWRGEFHNRKKNGEHYWEFAILSPIKDDSGKITHYLAVKEDITRQKEREQERDRMELQLRQAQKLESIGQLAAGVAHEINTPMQYVGDNTRFLKDSLADLCRVFNAVQTLPETPLESHDLQTAVASVLDIAKEVDLDYLLEEIPKAIDETLLGAGRVSEIVLAMKDFSHPGTGQKVPIDLAHAIHSTLTVTRNQYKYVADVETAIDPDLPLLPCYPGEFNQVILNLVVNAAHAIADKLDAESGDRGKILVSARKEGDWMEVRVQDDGTGIPESARNRIFDPFFTTKDVGKGTGQGLAIAHSAVVDKHGGTLGFETQMGHGTTFVVRLPLDPLVDSSGPANPPPDPVATPRDGGHESAQEAFVGKEQ